MSETEYFRQACKDQVKFTEKLRMNKDHEIALLELKIKELEAVKSRTPKLTGIERRFQEDMIDNYNNMY